MSLSVSLNTYTRTKTRTRTRTHSQRNCGRTNAPRWLVNHNTPETPTRYPRTGERPLAAKTKTPNSHMSGPRKRSLKTRRSSTSNIISRRQAVLWQNTTGRNTDNRDVRTRRELADEVGNTGQLRVHYVLALYLFVHDQ